VTYSILTAASLLFLAGTAFAQEPLNNLSLKDAVKLAVERNLDVKAELYNAAQAESDIRKNRAIYETHLTADSYYNESKSYGPAINGTLDQKTFTITPGIYRLLPTGGTLDLSFGTTYKDNSVAAPLGTYWESALTLSFTQPLLKNFGKDATELNIRVAEFSKDSSVKRFKNKLLNVVAQVRNEYFKLYGLREDLVSKKSSLELAKKILKDTDARVKAGVLPAMEILNAQFGVAAREKELIDSEKAVQDQSDVLQVLLQLESLAEIIPTDAPSRAAYAVDINEAMKKAVANRPEVDDLKIQIESSETQTRVAKGRTMPDLSLTSSVAMTGLDNDYGRNLDRVGSGDYPVWSVGLKLDYPLGNQSAENDYIKNKLKTDQLKTQLDLLKSTISSEVRSSGRALESSFKQLDVADRGMAYAEERLKAYLKKSEVGLATTKDLLDVENDMVTARTNQIRANATYTAAVSQFWKSTGELLEREGINVSGSQADELYGKAKQ
jgi:outer membrane protein TolC